ncbi:aldo/keto reductase [Micromonospora sp. M12]
MKYRLLGSTGVYVSEISLGAMTFGGSGHPLWGTLGGLALPRCSGWWTPRWTRGQLRRHRRRLQRRRGEELLGKALGKRRRDVVLATKVHSRTGPGPNDVGTSRLHIMQNLEDSLRRLGTDHIDLYQIHNFDQITPMEEMLRALDDAVRQGKVRYIGAANFAAWQMSKALGISAREKLAGFVSVQEYYSLLGRDVERDVVPMALDEGVGLTVWSPLAGGFLSGKVSRDGAVADSGARSSSPATPASRRSIRRSPSEWSTCSRASPSGTRSARPGWRSPGCCPDRP